LVHQLLWGVVRFLWNKSTLIFRKRKARCSLRGECDASDSIFRQNWGSYSRFAAQEAQITPLPWEAKTEWFWQFQKHHALRIRNGVIILWSIFYLSSYWECYSRFAVRKPHFPSTCKSSLQILIPNHCTTFHSIISSIGWHTAGFLKTRKMKPNSWNSRARLQYYIWVLINSPLALGNKVSCFLCWGQFRSTTTFRVEGSGISEWGIAYLQCSK